MILAELGHYLADVVYEACEVQPIVVRMRLADPLSRLVRMENVWELYIRVCLVHKVAQHIQCLHHGGFHMAEATPLLMLRNSAMIQGVM